MTKVKTWQAWDITDRIQRFDMCPEFFIELSDYEHLLLELSKAKKVLEICKEALEKIKNNSVPGGHDQNMAKEALERLK